MPTPTRPYAAIPADAGKVLRPVLPSLSDEIIAAIAREVPDYSRPMEGEFGQVVRVGVERALRPLRRPIERPGERRRRAAARPTSTSAAARCARAAALERAARRLPRRRPRRVAALRRGGRGRRARPARDLRARRGDLRLHRRALRRVGEGYAEEQSAAAGERQRRRAQLVRLLAQDVAPSEETILAAAAAAAWPLPRNVAALVTAPAEPAASDAAASETVASGGPASGTVAAGGAAISGGTPASADEAAESDALAARLARRHRGGGDRGGHRAAGGRPGARTPARPPAPGRLTAAAQGRPAALGPAVPLRSPGSRSAAPSPRTRCSPRAGWATGRSRAPRSTCPRSSSPPTPRSARSWPQQRLAPLQTLADGPRARLTETLRAWLDRPGQVQAVAVELGVHPQTVRYRVKQLRELFGDRLEDPEARFELGLALRAGG